MENKSTRKHAFTHNGRTWENAAKFCSHYDVDYNYFMAKRRSGFSIDKAMAAEKRPPATVDVKPCPRCHKIFSGNRAYCSASCAHQKLSSAEQSEVVELYKQGYGMKAIAKRFGVTHKVPRAIVERSGIKMRCQSDAKAASHKITVQTKRKPGNKEFYAITRQLYRVPGVYIFSGRDGLPQYIGKATCLRTRIRSSYRRRFSEVEETYLRYIVTGGTGDAAIVEAYLIATHQPPRNRDVPEPTTLDLSFPAMSEPILCGKVAAGELPLLSMAQ